MEASKEQPMEQSMEPLKGQHNTSRPAAFFAVFPFQILICACITTGNAILPFLCDKESFVEKTLCPSLASFPASKPSDTWPATSQSLYRTGSLLVSPIGDTPVRKEDHERGRLLLEPRSGLPFSPTMASSSYTSLGPFRNGLPTRSISSHTLHAPLAIDVAHQRGLESRYRPGHDSWSVRFVEIDNPCFCQSPPKQSIEPGKSSTASPGTRRYSTTKELSSLSPSYSHC
jgi:hypothetical protein